MKMVIATTRFERSGKKGLLKPNKDGYYTMPIGALNALNSAGQYYALEGAEHLFERSSLLMRRLENGNLRSELGHPEREHWMNDEDFLQRMINIKEDRWCAHFKNIWLDHEFGLKNPEYKNKDMVAIIGEFIPAGPFKDTIQQAIDNPYENLNFSLRGYTEDFIKNGKLYRVLEELWTFDVPTEQGIAIANKWSSPAFESIAESKIKLSDTQSLLEPNSGLALESDREIIKSIQSRMLAKSKASTRTLSELPSVSIWSNW